MDKIPVILLAAGQSRRMGGADKLIKEVDGIPLVRRSTEIAMTAGPVIVALPPRPHRRYDALADLDVLRVPIPEATEGMNASLRGALTHVAPDAPAAMVMLADLPELSSADLGAVLSARTEHPDHLIWRGATDSGKPGHPVLFDRSLFSQLSELTGDDGAQSVVRANKDKVHLESLPRQHALRDLDTREDWDDWHANRTL
ncbi:NTP transferase domain-containing protein [Ruegeria sp. EL01]|jgi:CTP:molybdopterin cytidylyltransferase MocA|uniref:nucleotidyltransferase family protein n=1 Tax=Ruegeria sp. EL01 TaxID=2107578 RepID=UPI000EA807C2|nr:nucleotidyltransferase family protein [Ruegeria sp. EL01]